MGEFTVARTIAAPVGDVWAALADFGNIYRWNPGVTKSHLTGEQGGEVGATRHCELKPMGAIEERITGWSPEEQLVIHIYEMSAAIPLKEGVATFNLAPADGTTEVTIDYSYTPTLMGRLGGRTLQRQLVKGLGSLLKGLDQHLTQSSDAA